LRLRASRLITRVSAMAISSGWEKQSLDKEDQSKLNWDKPETLPTNRVKAEDEDDGPANDVDVTIAFQSLWWNALSNKGDGSAAPIQGLKPKHNIDETLFGFKDYLNAQKAAKLASKGDVSTKAAENEGNFAAYSAHFMATSSKPEWDDYEVTGGSAELAAKGELAAKATAVKQATEAAEGKKDQERRPRVKKRKRKLVRRKTSTMPRRSRRKQRPPSETIGDLYIVANFFCQFHPNRQTRTRFVDG